MQLPGWVLAACTLEFSALLTETQKSSLSSDINPAQKESFDHEENSPAEVNKQVLNSLVYLAFHDTLQGDVYRNYKYLK